LLLARNIKELLVPGSGLDSAPLNDPDQNDDHRENQKDMDESAHSVRRDKTKKPEDNEDDCNCYDHGGSPFKRKKASWMNAATVDTSPVASGPDTRECALPVISKSGVAFCR
jgi:hypothetical protein